MPTDIDLVIASPVIRTKHTDLDPQEKAAPKRLPSSVSGVLLGIYAVRQSYTVSTMQGILAFINYVGSHIPKKSIPRF